jgi:hypothetical protein
MTEEPNGQVDDGNYQRRTFMALLSALGVTGLAGCGGDDDGSDGTPTDTSTDDPATATTTTSGDGGGDTPTPTATVTETPPEPADIQDGEFTYSRPGNAGVVFGEGVSGLEGLTATPPDIGITEVPTYEEDNNTGWVLADGDAYFQTKNGTGNKWFREPIGDVHLHIEFTPPDNAGDASGQQSGNSGIFLMDAYEFQVLNNYENETYGGGYASALYQDAPPLVDPARPPSEWNAFDIIWRTPEFDDDGNALTPAACTVFFNGVCVLPHINVRGPNFGGVSPYSPHPEEVTVRLQDHAGISDVSYRNIWYQNIPDQSETGGVSTFRQQYEYDAFADVSSTDDYISEPFHASFPENYRANEGNDYGPPVVSPGPDLADPPGDGQLSTAPDDATVLLEGGDMSGFADPGWNVGGDGGFVTVAPGSGNVTSSESFGDAQVHVEFRIPEGADDPDSGVILDDNFEINIAADGTGAEGTGAFTYQAAPLRDATLAAGEWQAFDIIHQGPEFGSGGATLERPGRATVLLNGQVVQKRVYFDGPNTGGEVGSYADVDGMGPISLQENGSEVDFKYVWARSLYPEQQRQ